MAYTCMPNAVDKLLTVYDCFYRRLLLPVIISTYGLVISTYCKPINVGGYLIWQILPLGNIDCYLIWLSLVMFSMSRIKAMCTGGYLIWRFLGQAKSANLNLPQILIILQYWVRIRKKIYLNLLSEDLKILIFSYYLKRMTNYYVNMLEAGFQNVSLRYLAQHIEIIN